MNIYDCSILLVDDNEELARMTVSILKRSGYETGEWARDCREAMEKLEPELPRLVILDIMLPDGDGFFQRFYELWKDSYFCWLSCKR